MFSGVLVYNYFHKGIFSNTVSVIWMQLAENDRRDTQMATQES